VGTKLALRHFWWIGRAEAQDAQAMNVEKASFTFRKLLDLYLLAIDRYFSEDTNEGDIIGRRADGQKCSNNFVITMDNRVPYPD